jgi:hypothetical protein
MYLGNIGVPFALVHLVRIRQHTSAYVSIRQHTLMYLGDIGVPFALIHLPMRRGVPACMRP